MKIKIYIENEWSYMDGDDFIEVEMQCLPRKKELLYLSESQKNILCKKITRSKDNAETYNCYYGKTGIKIRENEILRSIKLSEYKRDVDISDYIYVSNISYEFNNKNICEYKIILSDSNDND